MGPKGRMVNKIQETTRTYIEVCETRTAGVSQATITGTAEAVNAAIAGIQQVAATGQYKPSARTFKHDTSWIAEPPGIGTQPSVSLFNRPTTMELNTNAVLINQETINQGARKKEGAVVKKMDDKCGNSLKQAGGNEGGAAASSCSAPYVSLFASNYLELTHTQTPSHFDANTI